MRSARGDVREPHRFTQKRPRTFVSGLASIAAVETSKHPLSRDFQRRSIFDFCNNIGTKRTWRDVRLESVMRSKADIESTGRQVCFDLFQTSSLIDGRAF